MMSDYKVNLVDENPANFYIIFHGPKDSARPPSLELSLGDLVPHAHS